MKIPPPKKILVVAESIDVEDSSGSKANVALIRNLNSAGFEVQVFHYTRKEIELPGIRCIEIKEKKNHIYYFLSRIQRKLQHGLKINLAQYLEPRFGFSFTFLNDSRSIAEKLRKLKDYEPDLILTLSKGASFRPHHALLQVEKYWHIWIAYIHDPYPLGLYPEPYTWKEPGFEHKRDFFSAVAKSCRWAAFPSEYLLKWMESFYPNFKGKGKIIPHQLEITEVKEPKFPAYFDPTKFNILHAGSILDERNPEGLLAGFQKFLNRNSSAQQYANLILLGGVSQKFLSRLNELKIKVPQFFFISNSVEFETVRLMQGKACVNVILEAKAVMSPFLPGKFPHCIAADKPILHLGPEKSEVTRLMGQNYSYHSEVDDADKIANLLEELYNLWRTDKINFRLNRPDLWAYLSVNRLEEQINSL